MSYSDSEKIGQKIIEAINVIALSPATVGRVLANTNGPMKYRVYQIVRAVIAVWQVDVKHDQINKEDEEIYNWVKGLDNGKH
jgi:hypothetical protein